MVSVARTSQRHPKSYLSDYTNIFVKTKHQMQRTYQNTHVT